MDDREQLLDDIARCFAHAAVDALLLEMEQEAKNGEGRNPGRGAAFCINGDDSRENDGNYTRCGALAATSAR